MADNEAELLLKLWEAGICPTCGKPVPDGTRVGTGRRSDGGFCSLDCYAAFYAAELAERARLLAKRAEH